MRVACLGERFVDVIGEYSGKDIELGADHAGGGGEHGGEHQANHADGQYRFTSEDVGLLGIGLWVGDAVNHRRQQPEQRAHKVENAKEVGALTGVLFGRHAEETLNKGPLGTDHKEVDGRPAGEEEDGVFLLLHKVEKPVWSLLDKTADTSHLMQGEGDDKEDGQIEDDELQHIGHEHCPEAADHGVENHHRAEDEDRPAQ